MNPLRLASLILLFCLAFSPAHAAQKAIGTSCNSDNSTVDFDTLAQCNGSTLIKAPLMLGAVASPPYATTACDAAKAGMLQYTGGAVQYCNGSAWSTLGSSSGTGGQSMFSGWPDAIVCNVTNPAWGQVVFRATHMPSTVGIYHYGMSNGGAWYWVSFVSSGAFNGFSYDGTATGFSSSNCSASISTLVANGQAFNFVNGGANGAAAMADGTAGAPGLYFSADTNTGLYRPTTDNLAIATGGVERLRVTATGSVGIGTTSPADKLMLATPAAGNLVMRWYQTGVSEWWAGMQSGNGNWQLGAGGGFASPWITVNGNNGNVGIGTTTPAYKLDINNPAGNLRTGLHLGNGGTDDLFLTDNSSVISSNAFWNGGWYYNSSSAATYIRLANGAFDFRTAPSGTAGATPAFTARMYISNTGSVGIGTTTPSERLDLGGGNIKMGWEIITKDCYNTNGCTALCSAEKQITGGGCSRINAGSVLDDSYPGSNGWNCFWENPPIQSRAVAICANIR